MIENSEFQNFPDNRPIADLPLGVAVRMHDLEIKTVRDILTTCGVSIAEDVATLGCSGVAAKDVMPVEAGKLVRSALAGTGVIFPCFVGRDRYCLVHETIGGLQDKQEQLHADHVNNVSRELTKDERKHVEVVESARRITARTVAERSAAAQELLRSGVGTEGKPVTAEEDSLLREMGIALVKPWTCPEHGKTLWSCRYCIAQAIVEGPLEVELRMDFDGDVPTDRCPLIEPREVEDAIEKAVHGNAIVLFARVARWTRRLARE